MVACQRPKRRFSSSIVCAAPPQKKFKPKQFIDIPENDANLRGQSQIQPAPMHAKTGRTVDAADLVYRSPGPLPPSTGMSDILRWVLWTRSRTGICKFCFWIADLGRIQANWCRVESQKRGTLHLHCLCYALRRSGAAALGWELPRGAETVARINSPHDDPGNASERRVAHR